MIGDARQPGRVPFRAVLLGLCLAVLALGARAQTVLDMRDVELRSFVEIVAEETGRNFVVDPAVSGNVTVIAPAEVTPETIYEIFLNVLELNQLTIVEGRQADRIVPIAGASELSGPGDTHSLRGGAYETRVIRIPAREIDGIVEAILPLVPREAAITPIRAAGLLVISDRRENLDRIEALVDRLDAASPRQVESVRLRHADAAELLEVIQMLEIVPAGASLSADTRGNALVMSGPADFRGELRGVIRGLDTPQQAAVSRVVRLDYADAAELAEVLSESVGLAGGEEIGSDITVVAEPRSNALLVNAPSSRIDAIVGSIRALDTKPEQVLIEAVVFEMSTETFSDLSVQFGGVMNDAIGGGTSFALDGRSSLITLLSAAVAGRVPDPGDGGGAGVVSRGSFAGFVTALARDRTTRLLSTPSVLSLNNQEASIVVAQNVPFVTGSFATVGESAIPDSPFETVERQDVGLTLNVRPQITRDGMVRMAISQEVSNLTEATSAAGGEITARRELQTNVMVGDGRVILLGGLMEQDDRTGSDRVPGLGDVPLLGRLFRGDNLRERQRMLLLMLRPRVIRDDREAERVTREVVAESQQIARAIDDGAPRGDPVALPFGGVLSEQPFARAIVDAAVRERAFPGLPPRLEFDPGR